MGFVTVRSIQMKYYPPEKSTLWLFWSNSAGQGCGDTPTTSPQANLLLKCATVMNLCPSCSTSTFISSLQARHLLATSFTSGCYWLSEHRADFASSQVYSSVLEVFPYVSPIRKIIECEDRWHQRLCPSGFDMLGRQETPISIYHVLKFFPEESLVRTHMRMKR